MRTYAFHGIELRDRLLLKAMVERASRRLEQEWIPGEWTTADCVFYIGEAPASVASGAALVHVGDLADVSTAHILHYPPRVHEVVSVLAAIDRQMRRTTEPATDEAPSWLKLAEQVQHFLAVGRSAALVDASGSGWVIESDERQFMVFGPYEIAPRVLLESLADQWRLVDAPAVNVQARRPLVELLWFLGIAAGREGVISGIDLDRPLRMRVWPYLLARAPRRFSDFAKLLRQGERSASELQAATDATAGDIAAFVNACVLCGFVALGDEPRQAGAELRLAPADTAPSEPTQRFTRFLGAIRHALGMPA